MKKILAVLIIILGSSFPLAAYGLESGALESCVDVNGNGAIDDDECQQSVNAACRLCTLPVSGDYCFDIDDNGAIDDDECLDSLNDNCSLCQSEDQTPPDANGNGSGGILENFPGEDLDAEGILGIIEGLAIWVVGIAATLVLIFVILAGVRFMMARGNPQAYEKAKKNFVQVLIGALVIFGVGVIINTAYQIATREFFGTYNR